MRSPYSKLNRMHGNVPKKWTALSKEERREFANYMKKEYVRNDDCELASERTAEAEDRNDV